MPTTSVCEPGNYVVVYFDSSTHTCPCGPTCPGPCPAALPYYASCTAFVSRRHQQYYCCWSSCWCCRAWTIPGHQLNRLQSVMNAAERLVCSARNYEHISLLLCDLQWLWVPEWTEFKLSMLVFRCLHGTALPYLVSELRRVADVDTRKRLRPTSMSALVTPSSCRTTIGDRAFLAALCIWNTLPSSITASGTLNTFKRRLKMHLFVPSFTSIFPNCVQRILFCILTLISVLEVIFTK